MSSITVKNLIGTKSEVVLVVFMAMILLVLFTPIPSVLLDFLLILNFSLALMVLLLTFYIEKPINFSTFPSLLLIATLFRLSLNIAATRLILDGADAGAVIGAVGAYVVGGNYVIGLVVFLILVVVQYVVVTSGAQRVAEVAARFTLDSMPGKQMSIDADLNMGLIDEVEAQERRKNIEKEANFYGSMDGASKFVKGDAIAGIIIIIIDIVGGLTVGLAQMGMTWGDALHTYTLLTVGDGIVTQIPALVISIATGIIVTRAGTDNFFGDEIAEQIGRYPKTLILVGVFLLFFMLLPGMPFIPVLLVVCIIGLCAYVVIRRHQAEESDDDSEAEVIDDGDLYKQINIESIEITVGEELIDLVGDEDGMFMEKIKNFRKQFAFDIGFVFPSVRLKNDPKMDKNLYEIRIFDAKVGHAQIFPDQFLAITANANAEKIPGVKTVDPTYGLPALWIEKEHSKAAKKAAYTLVDPLTVMVTHFNEIIKNNAHDLLTRGEVEQILQRVKDEQANLYDELIPNVLSLGDVQKVLQNLIYEKVSVRNIISIIEVLVDGGKKTKSHDDLTEYARQKLGRSICEGLINGHGELNILSFDPSLETVMQNGLRISETKTSLVIDPGLTEKILKKLGQSMEKMMMENIKPVLLCSPALRRHFKKLTDRVLPHLSVLALTEIPSTIQVKSYEMISIDRNQMGLMMPREKKDA